MKASSQESCDCQGAEQNKDKDSVWYPSSICTQKWKALRKISVRLMAGIPRCGKILGGRTPSTENTADLIRDSWRGRSYKSLSAVSECLLFPSPVLSPGSSQIKRPGRCSCHRRLFLKRLLKGGGTRVMQGPLQGMRGSGSFTLLITTPLLFWKFSLTLSPCYLQSDNKANIVHQVSIWSDSVILRSFVFIFSAWHPKKTRFMSSYCLSYVLTVGPFLLTFESHRTGDTGLWEKLSFSDRNWVSLRLANLPLIGQGRDPSSCLCSEKG